MFAGRSILIKYHIKSSDKLNDVIWMHLGIDGLIGATLHPLMDEPGSEEYGILGGIFIFMGLWFEV